LRGFAGRYPPPRGMQDANLPGGSAAVPDGVAGEGPHEVNVNRREQGPFAPRRNPSAFGAIGVPPSPVVPSTDGLRGAQSPGFPAAIPQAGSQPSAFPSTMAPGGVFGRAGPRGPIPGVANMVAPALSPPTPGLQQLPGLQQAPIAPAAVIAPVLPVGPPPVAPAPQSAAPQPYQRSPIGRLPQRDQGL
jgi:hypothetical protein